MALELTPAQKKAIETHDRDLIVVAAAGSGKTHVLVQRFIQLLLNDITQPLNAIVAITFTRKAAQEMRDRVRQELLNLLRDEEDARRRDAYQRWISQMDRARIQTIHSLCSDILRINAAVVELDPAFEVLEEGDAYLLQERAIEETLRDIALERDGAPEVKLIMEHGLYIVRNALKRAAFSGAVETVPSVGDLFETWADVWEQYIFDSAQRVLASPFAQNVLSIPQPDNLQDKIWLVVNTVHQNLARLKLILAQEEANPYEVVQLLEATYKVINLQGGSAKSWGGKEFLNEYKNVLKAFCEYVKSLNLAPISQLDEHAADNQHLWLSLIARIQARYQALKKNINALDYDDLEHYTCALLEGAQGEDIRNRYRGEVRHILVDEFQDTNQTQWYIIKALAPPSGLFVVGDPRQSIYAFRGADVSVFGRVQRAIECGGGQTIALTRSFRSHQGLIDVINHIFSQILCRDEHSPVRDYEIAYGQPMEAMRLDAPTDKPPVELLLLNPESKDDVDDKYIWEAYEIAERIQQMIDAKLLIYDKHKQATRPIELGDIAVLFRRTTYLATYEDAFKDVGLHYVTLGGSSFFKRQEIWDVLNLLRAAYNPQDNLALAVALRSPLFGFSDDMLYRLRRDRKTALWDALFSANSADFSPDEQQLLAAARSCLQHLQKHIGRALIADLINYALRETGYLATLSSLQGGNRLRRNVEKLVEIARLSGKVMLGEFLRYIEDITDREVRESEAALTPEDAVQLMTVHASKGLEFPVVIIADIDGTAISASRDLLVRDGDSWACRVNTTSAKSEKPFYYTYLSELQKAREIAESRRLFYVAATRAQDYLIISAYVEKIENLSGKDTWLGWLWNALKLDNALKPDIAGVEVILRDKPLRRGQSRTASQVPLWDRVAVRQLKPFNEQAQPPLGLATVQVEPTAIARHLSASHLADVGAVAWGDEQERPQYRRRLLNRLRQDAPSIVRLATLPRVTRPASARQIGEMVHAALRHWRFPNQTPNMRDILRGYASQVGLMTDKAIDWAVQQAEELLIQFQGSTLYQQGEDARRRGEPFYTELPFIYPIGQRLIHGVIDLLFKHNGQWHIVDYKTATLWKGQTLVTHARRYYLQVGVYAAATWKYLERFGAVQPPQVHIHYIRYGRSITVPTEVWQQEVAAIEHHIEQVMDTQETP